MRWAYSVMTSVPTCTTTKVIQSIITLILAFNCRIYNFILFVQTINTWLALITKLPCFTEWSGTSSGTETGVDAEESLTLKLEAVVTGFKLRGWLNINVLFKKIMRLKTFTTGSCQQGGGGLWHALLTGTSTPGVNGAQRPREVTHSTCDVNQKAVKRPICYSITVHVDLRSFNTWTNVKT